MFSQFLASIVFFLLRLISFLPFGILYIISKVVAFILKHILHYRRDVIIQNISRSFPDYKYKDVKSVADDFYLHFSDIFIELIKSVSLSRDAMKRRVTVKNPELLMNYYKEGNNIIALTGHAANWEWLSIVPGIYPFACYTLYKPLSSKISEYIMYRIRRRFGMKLLAMSNAAKYILSSKDQKALYIFIGDQAPAKTDNAHIYNFLIQKTTFFTGGARLARATKSVVVFISMRKVKRGYYSLEFIPIANYAQNPPLFMNATAEGIKNDPEVLILNEYARLLESDIKDQPVNWLWSHKRWKH